jgi:predicted MFS family arabinose efflux permease
VTAAAPSWREPWRITEFRTLWLAQAQSRLGDQLARVALALLVYDRTSSAALTGAVYALTFLPPLVTAPLLAGLADRYSRRTVLAATELVRAALVLLMLLPGLPLVVLVVLVALLACPQPVFSAARNAVLPTVLPGELYPRGAALMSVTDYVSQIAGFTLGAASVALLGGPKVALLADAVTFLLSAALLRRYLRPHRPAPDASPSRRTFALAGVAVLGRDRRLAGLAGLVWLFGLYVAPEALAAPYAHQVGAGQVWVGALMAADLAGAVVGSLLVARLPPAGRRRWLAPLAVGTGLPLVLGVLRPTLGAALVLWAVSGAFGGYQTLAQVEFGRTVPDALRGRAIGVTAAGLQTAQGVGVLAAGAAADALPPSTVIALCGGTGALLAALIGVHRWRAPAPDPVEDSG